MALPPKYSGPGCLSDWQSIKAKRTGGDTAAALEIHQQMCSVLRNCRQLQHKGAKGHCTPLTKFTSIEDPLGFPHRLKGSTAALFLGCLDGSLLHRHGDPVGKDGNPHSTIPRGTASLETHFSSLRIK